MPSLKMKTQTSTGCVQEKYGLRVSQKSNIISKKGGSHLRINECTDTLDACLQNFQDGTWILDVNSNFMQLSVSMFTF